MIILNGDLRRPRRKLACFHWSPSIKTWIVFILEKSKVSFSYVADDRRALLAIIQGENSQRILSNNRQQWLGNTNLIQRGPLKKKLVREHGLLCVITRGLYQGKTFLERQRILNTSSRWTDLAQPPIELVYLHLLYVLIFERDWKVQYTKSSKHYTCRYQLQELRHKTLHQALFLSDERHYVLTA